MENILWLFPVIFMLHELEEIIGFEAWRNKNRDTIKKYATLSRLDKNYSHEGFSLAVLEEYLLCILITGISIFTHTYVIWIGMFIAFSLHLLVHILQSVTIKRYVPALATSIFLLPVSVFLIYRAIHLGNYSPVSIIVSAVLCTVAVLVNLMFAHTLMAAITRRIKK